LRRTELILFAKEICVQHKFVNLLIFLDHGKKLYRNMMVKRYVIHQDDMTRGGFHASRKFEKFYKKNKNSFGCVYRSRSVRKMKGENRI
jgi:hypothetical protein